MRRSAGFSLVELMIVVAIIGILAAIAVPNYVAMQARAKRAEVPGTVQSIKTAELAYDVSYDGFVDAAVMPRADSALNKTLVVWDPATAPAFKEMGWAPDGWVRGNYQVFGATATDFRVEGHSDVDDDNVIANYSASAYVNSVLDPGDEDVY